MSKNKGCVEAVEPLIEADRLKVRLTVRSSDGLQYFAYLPDRELSALLPRSILLGSLRDVPPEILKTIASRVGTRRTSARSNSTDEPACP